MWTSMPSYGYADTTMGRSIMSVDRWVDHMDWWHADGFGLITKVLMDNLTCNFKTLFSYFRDLLPFKNYFLYYLLLKIGENHLVCFYLFIYWFLYFYIYFLFRIPPKFYNQNMLKGWWYLNFAFCDFKLLKIIKTC